MLREERYFDWRELADEPPVAEQAVGPRGRLRLVCWALLAALALVFGRAAQLELADGASFRRLAAQPLEEEVVLPAPRGQILAHDGTPLAADCQARGVAVQFRYLQQPPDVAWLRRQARSRLSPAERHRPTAWPPWKPPFAGSWLSCTSGWRRCAACRRRSGSRGRGGSIAR